MEASGGGSISRTAMQSMRLLLEVQLVFTLFLVAIRVPTNEFTPTIPASKCGVTMASSNIGCGLWLLCSAAHGLFRAPIPPQHRDCKNEDGRILGDRLSAYKGVAIDEMHTTTTIGIEGRKNRSIG
jgi:hypothetical protein